MVFLLSTLGQPASYARRANYSFKDTIGTGAYGEVREAIWTNPETKEKTRVAVKSIVKKQANIRLEDVFAETHILDGLDHPNVSKFYETFESRKKYFLVFQLLSGGELFEQIAKRGRFTEHDASVSIRMVLDGLKYLHDRGIIHRDLKPENLLYAAPDSEVIVIADFGVARKLADDEDLLTEDSAGSPGYAAPEALRNEPHGRPVDLFSLGVITYTLLCGYTPFRSADTDAQLQEIMSGEIAFHERYWKDIHPDAKDFIRCLLKPDPSERLTVDSALSHSWITSEGHTRNDISQGLRDNWNPKKAWKSSIASVVAINKFHKSASQNEIASGDEHKDGSESSSDDSWMTPKQSD